MSPLVSVPMRKMVPLPQATATTCWLTCFHMMFAWKGRDPAEIRPALEKAGVQWADALKTGLKTQDYMKAAKALGMRPWGTGTSWSAANFASFCTISPVWVAGRWHEYDHNVIVIGASREMVRFIDPWWQVEEAAEIKTWTERLFVHGDAPNRGTDWYMGWMGAVMVWEDAIPYGLVPE